MVKPYCQLRKLFLVILICCSMFSLSACQTLKKKFTRKPKSEQENPEEVIYQPQEYAPEIVSNENMYRTYFSLWKSWYGELVDILAEGQNHKKQVECISEMIDNLNKMKELLVPQAQARLNNYVASLAPIRDEIAGERSDSSTFAYLKMRLETLSSKITRDYLPRKVTNSIIK